MPRLEPLLWWMDYTGSHLSPGYAEARATALVDGLYRRVAMRPVETGALARSLGLAGLISTPSVGAALRARRRGMRTMRLVCLAGQRRVTQPETAQRELLPHGGAPGALAVAAICHSRRALSPPKEKRRVAMRPVETGAFARSLGLAGPISTPRSAYAYCSYPKS
ncbi:hypothetical protein CYMTET_32528 [Cymbomonas tetramitiformis]|uniref:Uncharacterized protein n=1 Tax=Cymbomonas tetramitiformis TaxID=36881 RepID=A0AAE0FEL4_9CHLO|nr:hypothetical protein CYMTET_32528 [Cymbomonas tetramitiformis]